MREIHSGEFVCGRGKDFYQETESRNLDARGLLRHGFEGSAHDGGGGEGAGDEGGAEEGKLGDGEGAVGEGEGDTGEGGQGKRRQAAELGGEEELPTREKEGANFWTIPERESQNTNRKENRSKDHE